MRLAQSTTGPRARRLRLLRSAARIWLTLRGAALVCLLLSACDAFKDHQLTPGEEVDIQLKKLQVAVEEGIGEGTTATLAVLGIIDGSQIDKAAAVEEPGAEKKKEKKDAEDPAAPLQRERKVRDALNASLVQNRLIELLQPDEATLSAARADMQASNSAALSIDKCKELGAKLQADYIAGSIIDEEGKSVSVAVQRVSDGVVVYQDVFKEWPAVVGETEPAADAAKK